MGLNREDLIPEINRLREEMKGKYGYARYNKAYKIYVKDAYKKGVYSKAEYEAAMRYEKVAGRYAEAQSYQSMKSDKNFKPIYKDTTSPSINQSQSILYTEKKPDADIIIKPSSQIKSDEFGEQYKLKQALPTYSLISEFTDREVALKSEPVMREPSTEITTAQEDRIYNLLEREERLQNFINLGGVLKKDETKSEWSFGEIGKTIARKPLEMGSAPVFLGGRFALAADLSTSKRGRQELGEAFGRVPTALGKAYDPRSPSGLINIGLTLTSIYSVGKARASARQEIKFSTEGIATKRINTKTNIIDQSKGRVEVLFGKKKITGQINTKETFYKTTDAQYFSEGGGSVRYTLPSGQTKTIAFDTRGLSDVSANSVNTMTIAKITKNAIKGQKYYLTATKSVNVVSQPLQTFRSISTTKAYGAATKTVYGGKPYTVSSGITFEAVRVPVFTESGKLLATEQVLNTGRISIGAKTVNQNYVFTQDKFKLDYLIKPTTTATSAKGGLSLKFKSIPKFTTQTTTTPKVVSTQTGVNVAVTQLKSLAEGLKSAQIKGYATTGAVALSGIKTGIKSQGNAPQSKALSFKLVDRQFVVPKAETKPIAKPREISAQKPISIVGNKPLSISAQSIQPITIQDQSLQPIQITELRTISQMASPATSPSITPIIMPPINPPMTFMGEFKGIPYWESGLKSRKAKRVKFKSKYVPSLEAELFNIKGKGSKIASLTGLGIRKITTTGGI